LAELLGDPDRLGRMAAAARSVATPDAAERLADLVERAAKR
jgi:UDP-N-acetylglucosamine--N-acetylmuramyl-(pentapeptide) pyrophosphoryl-undecaprenol N-acetylglucosamine transferase